MHNLFHHVRCALLASSLASLAAAEVKTTDETWHDDARNCDVPVRIYEPESPGPAPVIIFSHGLGGSRRGYSYLGNYWAEHGYFCVFPQHVGSDESVFTQGNIRDISQNLHKAVMDPQNLINRPKDVSFVINVLETRSKDSLKGKIDLARIGVAGHSFGSYTTLAIAGQHFQVAARDIDFADPRVKAAIPMSETPPARNKSTQFDRIAIPMLHMTGTKDTSPIGEVNPKDRRNVYDLCPNKADQYLIILDGATHMTFSGVGAGNRPQLRNAPLNPMHEIIQQTTTRFWDAYLKGDEAAKKDLRNKGFTPLLRKEDITESKPTSR